MAYAIRGNIEQIREVMPKRITELFVGGGGSKCNMWLKILANVTNLKILSPKIAESSSIGAAICAAKGIGIYPDFESAIKNMVHLKSPIIPDNKISQRYNELYKRWKNLYSKLLLFNSVK